MNIANLNAVIFDMDGVLIDSEPLHFEVDLMVLNNLGIDVDGHYLEKFVGFTNPAMWKVIKTEYVIEKSIDQLLEMQIATKLVLLQTRNFEPIEGILPLLKEIKSHKIPIGIASSSPRIFIEAVINKLEIITYFDTWISGEEVPKSKPEPDICLKCAQLLEINPANCVAIEDSKSGSIAAKKAGMKCIGFKNINSGNQDLSNADWQVASISEVSVEKMKIIFKNKK